MAYGEPTSQSELTDAKAYGRSRTAMKRAEERRESGHTGYAIAHGSAAVQAARIIAGVATARDNDKAEAMLSEVASLIASWRAGHTKSLSVMSRLDGMFPGSPSTTTL